MKKLTHVIAHVPHHEVTHIVHRAAVDRRHPRARAALQRRIVAEFAEMCGHPLTHSQAARLFGLPHDACKRILDELTRRGDLRRVRGHYSVSRTTP